MKLPRDLSGRELARALSRYGYQITRQTGSHMRLTTSTEEEHHITIPDHAPLRIGTLSSIVRDVADHIHLGRHELVRELFG